MTTRATVLLEQVGEVVVLTLNRPHSLNALNTELLGSLVELLKASAREAGAIVLQGAGRACQGTAGIAQWRT